jgi:hypothetical protein
MVEFDELLVAHRSTMRYVSVLIIVNSAWAFTSPFLVESIYGPSEEEGHIMMIVCFVVWMIMIIAAFISSIMVAIMGSETAAVYGMLSAWPIALWYPAYWDSDIYLWISMVAPIILSVLVVRMLWLAYLSEWKRPPKKSPGYPVEPTEDLGN